MGGLFEIIGGVVMIVVPEPATTAAGVGLVVDGIRRLGESFEE